MIKLDFHLPKNVIIKTESIEITVWFFLSFWIRSVKNGSNLIKLFGQKQLFGSNGFSAEIAFPPKILLSNLKWLFGLKWLFPNESALLLKVLKCLARLWWLKAFRLVLCDLYLNNEPQSNNYFSEFSGACSFIAQLEYRVF